MGALKGIFSFLKTGGSILTGLGVGAGLLGTADVTINGKDSTTGNLIKDVQETIGGAGAQANPDIQKTGFFSILKMLGEILKVFTNGKFGDFLINTGNRGIDYDSDKDSTVPSTNTAAVAANASVPPANGPSGQTNVVEQEARTSDLAGTATLTASAAAKGLGVKAVPGLASAFALGSGLWDTGKYLYNGEYEKAGVRLLSGAADTVLSAGGILSMAFATAAREGIEEGAQYALGDQVDMPDSPTLQIFKSGLNLVRN